MKYLIFLLLFVLSVPTQAQITLEHTYVYNQPDDIGLIQVDSGVWKYVYCSIGSSNSTIQIHNMDHSLERVINMPVKAYLLVIAKRLFDTDTDYCYLASVPKSSESSGLAIYNASGTLLFSRDSCYLGTNNSPTQGTNLTGGLPSAIKSTPQGAKMIITTAVSPQHVGVYSLPGKLPGCQKTLSAVNPTITYEGNSIPTSAYPNPASGPIRIAYQLPVGIFSGEIVVTSETGIEMKRFRVTNAFSDLLIEGIEFPSGSYFYKVVTDKGSSATGKFTVAK